ncbi:MAG: CBS domain-containing protein [Salinirussus sp.]
MADTTASSVMTTPFVSIDPDDPVTDAAKTMQDAVIGSLVVVDDENRPEGILTRSDFVDLVAEGTPLLGSEVPPTRSVMTTDIVTVTPDTPLSDVAATMRDHGIHHVPVVTEGNRVVGVVTTTDLADATTAGIGRSE